jgi:hypothetical protein
VNSLRGAPMQRGIPLRDLSKPGEPLASMPSPAIPYRFVVHPQRRSADRFTDVVTLEIIGVGDPYCETHVFVETRDRARLAWRLRRLD